MTAQERPPTASTSSEDRAATSLALPARPTGGLLFPARPPGPAHPSQAPPPPGADRQDGRPTVLGLRRGKGRSDCFRDLPDALGSRRVASDHYRSLVEGNILSDITLESGCTDRKGSGPQAGDLTGDDRLHDLRRAAVNPCLMKEGTMGFMKSQVRGTFLLGSGVGCSLLSVPGSNISPNTAAARIQEV
jgi:hypothetical protein